MRKSTMFISAMLTMFALATMFGVASAYQQIVKNNEAQVAKSEAPAIAVAQIVETATPAPTALPPLVVSPEQATTIAIEFLGDSNVYSVESVLYEGQSAYLVTFSAGDLVYVSSDGKVIANTKIAPIIVAAAPNRNNNGGSSQTQSTSSSSSSSNSGDDDHDGEDHDGGDHGGDDHDGGDDGDD